MADGTINLDPDLNNGDSDEEERPRRSFLKNFGPDNPVIYRLTVGLLIILGTVAVVMNLHLISGLGYAELLSTTAFRMGFIAFVGLLILAWLSKRLDLAPISKVLKLILLVAVIYSLLFIPTCGNKANVRAVVCAVKSPPPSPSRLVFERTFDINSPEVYNKDEGGIHAIAYGVTDIRIGDVITVEGREKDGSSSEVWIYTRGDFQKTSEGYYRLIQENAPKPGKYFNVALGMDNLDAQVIVRVFR